MDMLSQHVGRVRPWLLAGTWAIFCAEAAMVVGPRAGGGLRSPEGYGAMVAMLGFLAAFVVLGRTQVVYRVPHAWAVSLASGALVAWIGSQRHGYHAGMAVIAGLALAVFFLVLGPLPQRWATRAKALRWRVTITRGPT